MHVIRARNVREAYALGLSHAGALRGRHHEQTRNGPAVVSPEPVTTVYERPTERVLLDPRRDANPFFHLYESLWMLAGRDDARSLDRYVSDFSARYAESDGRLHDAYGRRWRGHFDCGDQLSSVVETLRRDPASRQCVITMWDPWRITLPVARGHGDVGETDIGANDLRGNWRARPCNTHVYLRVREVKNTYRGADDRAEVPGRVLDLTVLCRSNDIVWGAYGANAVQFSVLQEYLAARIGCEVGVMYQVSNNWHAYADTLERVWPPGPPEPYDEPPRRLVDDPDSFDGELHYMLGRFDELWERGPPSESSEKRKELLGTLHWQPRNGFLSSTARPALLAHWLWKHAHKGEAMLRIGEIEAPDWRRACREWCERRRDGKRRLDK